MGGVAAVPDQVEIYSLSQFLQHCLLPDDYEFSREFAAFFAFTREGIALLSKLERANEAFDESDIRVALVARWCGVGGPLVDESKSDCASAIAWLSNEIVLSKVRYAPIFGRVMHDRYVEKHGSIQISLSHDESQDLLRDVQQGVCQVGPLVAGPLGLLRSAESRLISPALAPILLRCVDRSCNGVNRVWLVTGDTGPGRAFEAAGQAGPPDKATLQAVRKRILGESAYYQPDNRSDLPWLIANGLLEAEAGLLLRRVVRSLSPSARADLESEVGQPLLEKVAAGRASLDSATTLQCLLLVRDADLVRGLDSLVACHEVVLGDTETRRTVLVSQGPYGHYAPRAELGKNGVRFVGSLAPVRRLQSLLEIVFHHREGELEWQLRSVRGVDVEAKLQAYLADAEPSVVARTLLFQSPAILDAALEEVGLERVGSEEDQVLLDRLLWKLGFGDSAPRRVDADVVAQLSQFLLDSDPSNPSPTSRDDRTRASGNELGVRLERLLGLTANYATWALLSDHFGTDRHERFTYSPSLARLKSSAVFENIGDEGFRWESDGKNSLGTLVEALRRLADHLERSTDKLARSMRPHNALPKFAQEPSAVIFPFLRTNLFGDLSARSQEELISSLREGNRLLVAGGFVDVRNRLSHSRPGEFPSHEEVLAAAKSVRDAMAVLDSAGLLPVVMTVARYESDVHRRMHAYFLDGDRNEIVVRDPEVMHAAGVPGPGVPQLILRAALPRRVTSPVRFQAKDDSDWRAEWLELERTADAPPDPSDDHSQSSKRESALGS